MKVRSPSVAVRALLDKTLLSVVYFKSGVLTQDRILYDLIFNKTGEITGTEVHGRENDLLCDFNLLVNFQMANLAC